MTASTFFKVLVKGLFIVAMIGLFLWKMGERIVRYQQENITLGDNIKFFFSLREITL
jgi:hypothetical protein